MLVDRQTATGYTRTPKKVPERVLSVHGESHSAGQMDAPARSLEKEKKSRKETKKKKKARGRTEVACLEEVECPDCACSSGSREIRERRRAEDFED